MNIADFFSQYRNYPVLFAGTGISLRYVKDSFTWDGLLERIAHEFSGGEEYYLDLKSKHMGTLGYSFKDIASTIENDFNNFCIQNRDGKFKHINDIFYEKMKNSINISRFKIYIASLLSGSELRNEQGDELQELRKARKNIGSIITTNYDQFIETVFDFHPLVGNDILLSNPYGSVYKIHGCVSDPSKIIITRKDYDDFAKRYELIRAQLLSLFIHNPIIFIGYSIGDENIKEILKTIFTYVGFDSIKAKKIRDNFLLVEYEAGSSSLEVIEHDIELENLQTIRINKIKTGAFIEIYKCLSKLTCTVSAMDVRKVQNIVGEIYSGGNVKVHITEDLESINNSDRIIAIGSEKTIRYQFQTISEIITNYFTIIEESNSQLLELINKQKIASSQWFPVYGFSLVCDSLVGLEKLKMQQKSKIIEYVSKDRAFASHHSISEILFDESISNTYKTLAIGKGVYSKIISLEDAYQYLRKEVDKTSTNYKILLCIYDYIKYSDE